jgi:CBS domain-containing protein/RNA polymerase-binding transcription factor DksA
MVATVQEWMTRDPVAVGPEGSALEALDVMLERGVRHLPVIDPSRRVLGVISIDDLRAVFPRSVKPAAAAGAADRCRAGSWRVSDVMTHAPETAAESESLAEAARKLASLHIGCLPVVDGEGRLVGLLSETDLLQALVTCLWSDCASEQRVKAGELQLLVRGLERERAAIARRSDPLAVRRLEAIDCALEHAAGGRLGTCEVCGGDIAPARLRALPGATTCVGCVRRGGRDAAIASVLRPGRG